MTGTVQRGHHRGTFLVALLLAVAVVVGGGIYALVGYLHTSGPDGAVSGYFTALRHGDEASALGFGDLPDGPRRYLSAAVLREQQRLAPISDFHIVNTDHSGSTATVHVQYVIDVNGTRATVSDAVGVHKHGRGWRLDRVAVATEVSMSGADDRATILGGHLPQGTVLFFPGAVPIRFDTANVQVDPGSVLLRLQQNASPTDVTVQPSAAGRRAMDAAVSSALASCIQGGAGYDPLCPLPDLRAVPGSLRGTLPQDITKSINVVVNGDLNGVFHATGTVTVNGQYAKLDFNNVASTVRGKIALRFDAFAYVSPVHDQLGIYWRTVTV